jgi:hypothetical protein
MIPARSWPLSRRTWLGISLLLFRPAVLFAQPSSPVPLKGANTVLLYTQDRPVEALRTIQHLLALHGFTIKPVDSGRALLAQHELPQQRPITSFQVLVSAMPDSAALVLGPAMTKLLLFGFGSRVYMANRGRSTGPSKEAFRQVEAVAKAYPGARLEYQINQ